MKTNYKKQFFNLLKMAGFINPYSRVLRRGQGFPDLFNSKPLPIKERSRELIDEIISKSKKKAAKNVRDKKLKKDKSGNGVGEVIRSSIPMTDNDAEPQIAKIDDSPPVILPKKKQVDSNVLSDIIKKVSQNKTKEGSGFYNI